MRLVPLLVALAACTVPNDQDAIEGEVIVVAPGLNGEWDDPDAVPSYRTITGTIQQAIAAASPGATILVQSGDFHEDVNFVVNDVRIVGAGAGETRIYGSVTINGATAGVTTGRLSRVSIINPAGDKTGDGLIVRDAQAFLTESEVLLWNHGAYLQDADNTYVARSVFRNNTYGVWADDSDSADYLNNVFRSNDIAGLTNYTGVGGSVAYNTLVGNAFGASSVVGFGGALQFGGATETEVVANNIVVSNFFGINCQACANDFKSNLVWGNFTNYANDASPQSDDVSADPRFAAAGSFDFRLTVGSPAVDEANGTLGVTEDFHGESRPSGLTYDIGSDEFVQSGFSLEITEVMANASLESVGEFVEIYNGGSTPIDLAGLVLSDGDEADVLTPFNTGTTVVAPGAYAVVVDPDYAGSYNIGAGVTIVTTQDTEVGNGLTTSDRVTLYESNGDTVIATFSYPDDPGDGISLEMVLLAQGDVAGNWRASACTNTQSAGAAPCFPPSGDPSALVITEVLANALDEATGEYVELWNSGTLEINAAGLIVGDGVGTDALVGFANSGTLIAPGEHALIVDSGFAFEYPLPNGITLLTTQDGSALGTGGLANTGEAIRLFKSDGTTVISSFATTFAATDAGNGVSWQRNAYAATDVTGSWVRGNVGCTWGISPGVLNPSAGGLCSSLIVNEVMANAVDEDTQEFVEIYNAGSDAVDLATVTLSDGTQTDTLRAFGTGGTVLPAGGYAVVLDAEYDDSYAIPAAALRLKTGDTTIGNSLGVTDEVSLWVGTSRLDVFNFPFNPGNGISAEQVDVYASDAVENWTAAPCANGASPGQANCAQGGSTGGSGTSLHELVITEVLANAVDEDTDEFVEIYNYGTTPIDVRLFTLWDGDQLDTIHDWYGGTDTIVAPGEYVVIIDNEYDLLADPYGLASEAVLLTTSDTTIGSGLSTADPVYLLEPDGSTLIDSFSSPSNPGNGVSIEKANVLSGDIASNWRASTCAPDTAGAANCP